MIKIFGLPEGEKESELYRVKASGFPVPVHVCTVSAMPYNTEWPGHQRPLNQTEEAAFLQFCSDGPCEIAVEYGPDFERIHGPAEWDDLVVRPLSKGIHPVISGKTIRFTVPGEGYYTLETGGFHHALQIFVLDLAKEESYEEEGKTATYRFEHGVFDGGTLSLKTGESLYVAGDAVLYATIDCQNASNVRIFGAGIIDQSHFERERRITRLVNFTKGRNLAVEGITFRNSVAWTIVTYNSENIYIDRVKMTGMWRYNTDGIDFCNSRNGVFTNCYLRNFDDVIVLKGLKPLDRQNVENVLVDGCVLWCDWGRPLEIGAETCADEYRNIRFQNCDLIHGDCILMDLQNGDRASVHDLVFRDIRCEYTRHQLPPVYQHDMNKPYSEVCPPDLFVPVLFNAHLYCGRWSQDMLYGENYRIRVEDIRIFADPEVPVPPITVMGVNPEHRSYDIRFRNVTFNGKLLKPEEYRVIHNEFGEITVEE